MCGWVDGPMCGVFEVTSDCVDVWISGEMEAAIK